MNTIFEKGNIDLAAIRNITTSKTGNQPLNINYPEDALLNFTGIAKKYIRPAEEYEVPTEDGYILKLFHIPGDKSNIVLLSHGLLSSSDDYIIRGNISLVYMLAEQGFDIWAMNFRGNRYSRRHITLNPDTDDIFWDFSMHEFGLYDYKAVIDFILEKSGEARLSVIAQSEGTSAFFITMAERPEYNNKIKVFIGLAPVCYLRHTGPTVRSFLQISKVINTILKLLEIEEIAGLTSLAKRLMDIICYQGRLGYELCFNLLGLVTGFNTDNIEENFAATIWGHYPAGTSTKNLLHYTHVYHLNKFCQFDYEENNLAVYGSFNPPVYDLKKVTAKIALFAAKGDLLLNVKDVERLRSDLLNVVHYQVVSDDKFNHLDYLWSNNAHIVLYPYVIDILTKYNVNF